MPCQHQAICSKLELQKQKNYLLHKYNIYLQKDKYNN